jgi:hypothetical protein
MAEPTPLQELRARAKELEIPGYTKMNEQQLDKAILIAENLDWDLEHYQQESYRWSRGGLPRTEGIIPNLERAIRLTGTAGSLMVAEAAMDIAGRIGGSQVAAHGFRIARGLHHERKFVQSLMRQPLASVADMLTHRGPAALINGSGHSARHHDSAWLDDAAHGDSKARRKILQERLEMLGH